MPATLSERARRQLERLGVSVHLGRAVTAIDARGVELGEERIDARTVLWAAGVAASPLGMQLGAEVDRAGRVRVAPDLSLPSHPDVFVVGDLASVMHDDKAVPGVAPAAMQEGRHAARNVLRLLAGKPTEPFRYVDKGSLATIGRKAAVAEVFGLRLSGLTAWFAWLAIHIFFLIGFRNRFVVLFTWAWAYLTYDRSARLILGRGGPAPSRPSPPGRPGSTPSSAG
jgi:NADH dehydrogenase